MVRASRSFRLSTSRHLELALFELPPGAVSWSTARAHAGQQCHLLLQGTVRADYGDNTYRLEEGDSILWEGYATLSPGEHWHQRGATLDCHGASVSLEAG